MGVLAIWIIGAIVAGILASKKKRSVAGWVIGSLVLTPLIIVILLVISPIEKDKPKPQSNEEWIDTKKCPFCAEDIRYEAILCRFCKKELPDNKRTKVAEPVR